MSKCDCYHRIAVYDGVCYGTKECDPCECGGDESKCDFYPKKRDAAQKRWLYMGDKPRRIEVDGRIRCPECGMVFYRIVGTWYKHCPECATRLTPKEEER